MPNLLRIFYEALEWKRRIHAAPPPEYYLRVGIAVAKNTGYQRISENFRRWIEFLQEMFPMQRISTQIISE